MTPISEAMIPPPVYVMVDWSLSNRVFNWSN